MPDALSTPDPEAASTRITRVDAERKHLEGLFKDRINFQIIFASLFMVGLGKIDDPKVRVEALVTITIVSLLMAIALLRTFLLVRQALKEIATDDKHPYTGYIKHVWRMPNANTTLIFIPFLLSAFFAILTFSYGMRFRNSPHEAQDQSSSCTTIQVEGQSDRRVMSETEASKSPAPGGTRGTGRNEKQKH